MRLFYSALYMALVCLVSPVSAGSLDQGLELAKDLNDQAVSSQKKIDSATAKTKAMLEEYQQLMLDSDFHETQKNQLLSALEQQRQKKQSLQQQLQQIQQTEKRLAPLLLSMVQALERFILLDVPFHHQERIDSVLVLRERILDPALTLADRFQLVMEAFQIELDYGYSLEAYRDQIAWQEGTGQEATGQGEQRSVECLRIGRLALYFVTPDGNTVGIWNRAEKRWQLLSPDYRRPILDGIKVAKGLVAPELLPLPLLAELNP